MSPIQLIYMEYQIRYFEFYIFDSFIILLIKYIDFIIFKTKELLEKLNNKPKGHLWLKKIRPNFKLLEKMNDDITALKNRQTTPRTWKDLNHNTMYWE